MRRRSIALPGYLRQAAVLALTGGGMVGVLLLLSRALAPPLREAVPMRHSPAELRAVEMLRDNSFDPAAPLVLHVPVAYDGATSSAPWFPRGESPLLAELTAQGLLPPVAERVGPEPCVVRGVDGIGTYGGTWLRLNDLVLTSRMSYTALARFSPHGFPIVPHLAKGWEVSADSRRWTFFLRRGVKWSDGQPFTSADIAYWWEHEQLCEELTGKSVSDLMLIHGQRGEVITDPDDPYRVTFAFPIPNGIFLAQAASYAGAHMLNSPAHYRRRFHPLLGDQALIERGMTAAKLPNKRALYTHISAWNNPHHPRLWPWVVRKYSASPPYTAVRNPYYWMVDTAGNQLPYIDQVMSEQVSQDMVAIRAAAGGVSVQSRYIGYDQYTYLMSMREAGKYEVFHWYAGDRSWFVIQPNLNRHTDPAHPDWAKKRALMREPAFRQAMSLAINRPAIIQALYNGQARPAQVAPGPESPFYNERALTAFTAFDPERANRMLDDLGLNRRDYEGCRTFPDGTRMTFYLDYTKGLTSDRPVQFVIDDWAAVGMRVIPRERQRALWEVERMALMHDFNVWISNNEHYPLIQPRFFAPVTNCYFAMAYAKWYTRGGLQGDPAAIGPGSEVLERDHPLHAALDAYIQATATPDLDEQVRRFQTALDIAADNVWSINLCTTPPALVVVQDGMRNVPKTAVYSWDFQSPGNAGIETYFMLESNNSEGTIADLRDQILTPNGRPGDEAMLDGAAAPPRAEAGAAAAVAKPPPKPLAKAADTAGALLRWLFYGIVGLFVVLLAVRHPYVGRRLVIMVPTLAIISVIVFVIIQLPPGDFLSAKIAQLQASGDAVDMQQIEDIEKQFHLDEPMAVRYFRWLGLPWFAGFSPRDRGLIQGYLGRSMETGIEVNQMVGDRLLLTFLISLGTILFTWMLALPTGIYAAVKQYSPGDYILTFVGFIGMCVPGFLLALLLMYLSKTLFGVTITGLFSPEFSVQPEWTWAKIKDLLAHIWIPIIVIGVSGTAGMIRVMRANLLDELKKPYVTTARAKGVRPFRLLMKYPVRLALNPFISGIGGLFPMLISGSAIVSIVLSLPTVGPLMLDALMTQDMYLAGSMLMVLSLLGILGTLVSDLLLLWVDPRIRFGGGSR